MTRARFVLLVASLLAVAYGVASTSIVSLALRTRHVCQPPALPPDDLAAEPVTLRSEADDTPLAGWLVPSTSQRGVVLLHGIDRDAWAAGHSDLTRAYAAAGFSVLLFDLRAHGRSGGDRISLGELERTDVRAAIDRLVEHGARPGRIGIHGTSYGAAMALLAAAEIPEVGAVVADSPFADVRDLMAAQIERRIGIPATIAGSILRPGIESTARLVFGLDLPSLAPSSAVASFARPLLLIHGDRDRVIPSDHSTRLRRQAAGPTELWIMRGLGHAQGIRNGPCHRDPSPTRTEFLTRVVGFLERALTGG